MKESEFQTKVAKIVSRFTAAITNLRLYSHVHSLVSQHLVRAHDELSRVLEVKDAITLFVMGEDLILNNCSLLSAGQAVERFVKIIRDRGVERVTFLRGVSLEEFEGFIRDIATKETGAVRSWAHIKLGRVEIRVKSEESPELHAEPMTEDTREILGFLSSLDEAELDKIRELYLLMEGRKQLNFRGVDDSVKKLIYEIQRNLNPLSLLATVKSTDEYTFTHVVNVCILTLIQAQKLGFSGRQLYDIGLASLLHDVGKTFIPDEILSKPGALTPEERAIIETHPIKGGRYLIEVGDIPKLAILAAMEHHLRFDGSGYPAVRPGWKPNIVAQMITVADVFDALRSRRSYSAPKSMDQIVKILKKETGTTFNPLLVKSFLEIVAPGLTESHPRSEAQERDIPQKQAMA
jgi:HD-GYP domain-containing protein (c-di-GMP phosphodiesterase class II)